MRHPDSSLAAYVEGTATARERATAEAHLASCAVCRKEVTRARRARTALAALLEVEAPGIDVSVVVQLAEAAGGRTGARAPGAAEPVAPAVVPARRATRPLTEGEVAPPAPFEEALARAQDARAAAARSRAVPTSTETPTAAASPPVGDAVAPTEAVEPASVTELPAEGERVRRRRERDRTWQLRVVQGALGAAAVLVAIVLFVGLRTSPEVERSAGSAPEGAGQPGDASSTFGAAQSFDVDSFNAYVAQLAEEARTNQAVRQARDERALAASPQAGQDASPEEAAIACINREAELVGGTHLYSLIQATFDGRPVHVGAFLSNVDSERPVMLVIAASVEGCDLVRLAQQPL